MAINPQGIYDETGRFVAPTQTVLAARPDGPWSSNTPVRAVYAFQWDLANGEPPMPFFHIVGGPSDRSTVSAETLRQLGIAEPEAA